MRGDIMFSQTGRYYDKIYDFKDYQAEAQHLNDIINENLRSGGERLLDVACGTGLHIEYLSKKFNVEGLDLSPELLEIARQRNPDILFHCADMMDFDLGCRFDVVTCLFSSIGYVKTLDSLVRAIGCMTNQLVPGGILLVEPWFTPNAWHAGTVHAVLIDEPELKIARVSTSMLKDRISYFDLHYLIGTPEGTEHYIEHHELGLFEIEEFRAALEGQNLEVTYDDEGLMGRGLWIGLWPK